MQCSSFHFHPYYNNILGFLLPHFSCFITCYTFPVSVVLSLAPPLVSLHRDFPSISVSPFFLFYFTLLQLLFHHPRHPCPSLTPPSRPLPSPSRSESVCRQLLSGKVTLCVISAFHGSPLSLQRVIISFRVKGSICYKRTRASGMEGARVGVWGGEERRMELIGWERGRKVGGGDEGWKWEWMRGWDREAMREEQPKHSIFTVLRACVVMLGGVGGGCWRHSSLVSLSGPRLHHLAQTQRPGNINGVQKKKARSSEAGYFRLHCCFLDPYLYLDPAGILDVANTVINNQSSEFNQSVPHCFPWKSFVSVRKPEPSASASAAWCSSFLPAAPSQLSPNAFSLHFCFMDKHLFDLFFFPICFSSWNCMLSRLVSGFEDINKKKKNPKKQALLWKAPVVSVVVVGWWMQRVRGFLRRRHLCIFNKPPWSCETATSHICR